MVNILGISMTTLCFMREATGNKYMKRHSCGPTKYVPAGRGTIWPAGCSYGLLVQSDSQTGAHRSPEALVKFRVYLCYKWCWCCGYSTLLALASPHFLWCSILALSIPPSWHASSITRPSGVSVPGCILEPAFPPPLPSSTHFTLVSWMSSLEKILQMRSRTLLPICTALDTSPSEWSSQLEFLYLLVQNSIYCLLCNVSCLRGDNTSVLLIDLYHVPGTVSQIVTTLQTQNKWMKQLTNESLLSNLNNRKRVLSKGYWVTFKRF